MYIQPQLRRELVKNETVTGPGQSQADLSEVVEVIRMAINVPDPLREVLDSRHAVQHL